MTKRMTLEKSASVLLPAAFGIILIILLQTRVIHMIFGLKIMQLPLPFDIASAFVEKHERILSDAGVTVSPALAGMVLGGLLGYGAAMLATRYSNGGYGILILLTLLNSVPIVALAPIMNRWFTDDFVSKLMVVTIVSCGAVAVNAFRGLNDLPEYTLDLMHTYAATPGEIFRKLRIPNSVPYLFTALKINVASAMIGTVISEFFASGTAGLGYMIKYSLKVGNQKAQGWAYIAAVAILSLLIYAAICAIERCLLKKRQ